MSGTTFNLGQLAKLQSEVSIAVATALPRVSYKFGSPKTVLRALNNRREIFSKCLEVALEDAIKRMLILVPYRRIDLVLSAQYDLATFYVYESLGMHIFSAVEWKEAAAHAQSLMAGTPFAVEIFEVGAEKGVTNAQIEAELPEKHFFDANALYSVIAELISRQPHGEAGDLENTGEANVFYTGPGDSPVHLSWRDGWLVGQNFLNAFGVNEDARVFCPAS